MSADQKGEQEAGLSLDTALTSLNGVGRVVAGGLERLGLLTVQDLLMNWPRRWEDYSTMLTISRLRPGRVTLKARVERVHMSRTARKRVLIVEAILSDSTGTTKAVWFNQPYITNLLKEGESYYFAGEFAFKSNNLALQQPTFTQELGSGQAGRIYPIYSENSLVNSRLIGKLIDQVIDVAGQIPQTLPEEIVQKYRLLHRGTAIAQLHQPGSSTELARAKRSLGFEELFLLVLTGLTIRADIAAEAAPAIKYDQTSADTFVKSLGFRLTDDQRASAWQIIQDMGRSQPMNRLLLGDVGSGKTAVALMAAAIAAHAGYQTALMVPTEILARQHFSSANKILEPLGVTSALVIAGNTPAEKTAAYESLSSGSSQLAIGTHSLLSQKLSFANLGLVVIDEQHRFGVDQRTALRGKAKLMPHLLAMTATPIPRTLALTVYGDLDISFITQLPPGRSPIITKLYMEIERANAYSQIDEQIAEGRQVFIICPRIDATDKSDSASVKAEHDRLQKTVFAHRRMGLLHGQLKSLERQKIMADFVAHKLDILVATSMVEVGVDVPNASVMMIEAADRFGLAALHQLRGRVGRASHQSYCYLFSSTDNEVAVGRLGALERTTDGARLAQIDLENRGAGEIYGTSQHGRLDLRMADLTDTHLLRECREAAQTFHHKQDMLEYPIIAAAVMALQKVTSLD